MSVNYVRRCSAETSDSCGTSETGARTWTPLARFKPIQPSSPGFWAPGDCGHLRTGQPHVQRRRQALRSA